MSNTNNEKMTFNASCKACRISKSKCILDDGHETCARCRSAGRQCYFQPGMMRQRRKRRNERVKVLEGQVGRIKEMMERKKKVPTRMKATLEVVETLLSPTSIETKDESMRVLPLAQDETERPAISTISSSLDHLIPSIISVAQAQDLLHQVRQTTISQFPLLKLSSHDTFERLLATKPTLLLAILTAGSASGPSHIFKALHAELTKTLAMRVFVNGERSLELVQALLVMEVWYCLPDELGEGEGVNFYQWIHIAGTMALQLGLGRGDLDGEEQVMEEARTLLAVWVLCSCVAVSLRRENVMNMTPALQDCLAFFEKKAAALNDKRLLAWVRLQTLAEEIQGITPNQTHLRGSSLSKSGDTKTEVYCFQAELDKWEESLEEGVMNESLHTHHLYTRIKLHELSLHTYFDLSQLVAYPFHAPPHDLTPSIFSPLHVKAARPCIEACHALLEYFLSIPADRLAGLPTVVYVRAIYARRALNMLETLGDARVESVHEKVERHLMSVIGSERRQVPKAILGVWRGLGEGKVESRPGQNVDDMDVAEPPALTNSKSDTSPESFTSLWYSPDLTSGLMAEDMNSSCFDATGFMEHAGFQNEMMDAFLNDFAIGDLAT